MRFAHVRGYREAIAAGCDWTLEMDGGFSHQPKDLPAFFQEMTEGYDRVFGSRFCEDGQITDTPWKRRFISLGGPFLPNLLLGTKLRDMTSGYELFSRPVLQEILARGFVEFVSFWKAPVYLWDVVVSIHDAFCSETDRLQVANHLPATMIPREHTA